MDTAAAPSGTASREREAATVPSDCYRGLLDSLPEALPPPTAITCRGRPLQGPLRLQLPRILRRRQLLLPPLVRRLPLLQGLAWWPSVAAPLSALLRNSFFFCSCPEPGCCG